MSNQVDFATRFHNLDGDLKGERKKSLFELLNTAHFDNETQLESALQCLKPTSFQENLFYIDTLIYFKRSKELIEILKGGNDIYISKILKQAWFFQNGFNDVEVETFVTEFLPHLSYGVKKKFLSRISNYWNEQKMDSLFEALEQKYSSPLAVSILHKCSIAKIRAAILEFDFKLNSNQVLNMYKRSEDLFRFYLDRTNNYNDEKVLNHIAVNNPKLFLELRLENKILEKKRIGRRTSKGLFDVVRNDILEYSEYYLDFLNKAVVTRKLGKDFDTLFKNLFPQKLKYVSVDCMSCNLLQFYPKNRRWNLLKKTFKETFKNHELNDLLLNLSQMDKLNPPQDVGVLWAELHYKQKVGNYNDYLKFYPPSKAIPILKEKINVTSDIHERNSLVLLMVESCRLSQELDELVGVLNYICFRHKNEEYLLINTVVAIKNGFKLEDFDENHWKYIDEQIQILRIQKKLPFYQTWDIIEAHLKYLVNNGKDYKPSLIEYLKDMFIQGHSKFLSYKDLSLSKRLYTDLIENLDVVKDFKCESDIISFKFKFLETIFIFCQENPEFCIKIADFPTLIEIINESFNNDSYYGNETIANVILYDAKFPQYAVAYDRDIFTVIHKYITKHTNLGPFHSVFHKILLIKDRDDFANKLLKFYFQDLFEIDPDPTIVCWFLKNEPKILSSHMAVVAANYVNCLDTYNDFKMYSLLRHYSHLGFDKIVSDYLTLMDVGNVCNPMLILIPLSILLSTDEYIKYVSERYLPKKDKLDLMDEAVREIYFVQCQVAKLLARVQEPYKMLPTIMKFCKGDYLQSGLPSLQKAFYRSPEKILYSYVETLSKQAVSVRKHAIFLSCEVLDKQHTLNLLTNTKESNASSFKYLFSATLKYFLKNPSEELLDKVLDNFNSIDVNDKETLDSLKDVIIPIKYRVRYLKKCWVFFEGLESEEVKTTDYLNAFLNQMSGETLSILSASFITDIIKNYFPDIEERLENIDGFVICVLQSLISQRNQNFKIVFDILSTLCEKTKIAFFNSFVNTIKENPDQQLLAMFAENWYKNFTLIDSFDEHIALKLISFRFDNYSVDNLARKTVNYLEELITEFGFHCFDHFTEQFEKIFDYSDAVEEYKLYLAILKYSASPSTCTLVLNNIINMSDDEDETMRNIFNEVINIIGKVATPIVRINLKAFLIDNELETFLPKAAINKASKCSII